ncbi:hypothetical protein [Promicromonospora iranensis]|uniref:Uncharacterized protein n=1 Tax=Promicromonospora iranensis TaxID=1105144 RepID=A0ABU2CNJ8_9MICO|nr:hypothetical protein [Promicromonospora iranensis]MDR7382899.1 hypothetical protein [Promicromonospora iranensis]
MADTEELSDLAWATPDQFSDYVPYGFAPVVQGYLAAVMALVNCGANALTCPRNQILPDEVVQESAMLGHIRHVRAIDGVHVVVLGAVAEALDTWPEPRFQILDAVRAVGWRIEPNH